MFSFVAPSKSGKVIYKNSQFYGYDRVYASLRRVTVKKACREWDLHTKELRVEAFAGEPPTPLNLLRSDFVTITL
jgi:hypothetical protein